MILRHFGGMSFEERIATYLKNARFQSGLKYAEFAKKLGITSSSLARYESQEQSMTLRTLQQILRSLHVSLADILGEQEISRRPGRRG